MDIGVVLVTFNRKDELKKALIKYEKQKKKPEYIIVVNNNSTDGTYEFLNYWEQEKNSIQKYVINLKENIGGSGGFYTGLNKAMDLDCDWIWVADDDAYPEFDALSNVENFYETNADINKNEIAALCGAVINNNEIDLDHRRRLQKSLIKIMETPVLKDEYNNEYFEIDLFSYVGSILNKNYLKMAGLTEKEYFIYYDDTEHSFRLRKMGKILCIPKVKIAHNTGVVDNEQVTWKTYYGTRNKMLFIKKHFSRKYFKFIYTWKNMKCIASYILRKNDIKSKMIKCAIEDAKNNRTGIHEIYKPGWKVE